MRDAVTALAGPLNPPAQRVVAAGGKRLRPALTMTIAARLAPAGRDGDALTLAAAVELLHCATLVHDDLIDGAQLRRGVSTVSGAEGDAIAVVTGDLLIAAASWLACGVSARAGVVLARTLADLCRGQALEEGLRYNAAVTRPQLVDVAAAKTGALIRGACLFGALADGGEPAPAIAEFGTQFGISLQLVDDVLDVVSSPSLAGKPVGTDFASGTMTLPAAFALRAHAELAALLRADLTSAERSRALSLLRSREAIAPCVALAVEHARAAQEALRAAAERDPAMMRLAGWPLRYLRAQLQTKIDPRWADLITGAVRW